MSYGAHLKDEGLAAVGGEEVLGEAVELVRLVLELRGRRLLIDPVPRVQPCSPLVPPGAASRTNVMRRVSGFILSDQGGLAGQPSHLLATLE